MKKILLCVPLLALAVAGLVGCSQQRKWTHEQRKAMREALRDYRQMVYLEDLPGLRHLHPDARHAGHD